MRYTYRCIEDANGVEWDLCDENKNNKVGTKVTIGKSPKKGRMVRNEIEQITLTKFWQTKFIHQIAWYWLEWSRLKEAFSQKQGLMG